MFQWLYLQITFHIEVGGGAIKEIPGQQSLDCNGLYCVTWHKMSSDEDSRDSELYLVI